MDVVTEPEQVGRTEPMLGDQHQAAGRGGASETNWEGLARNVGGKPEQSRAPGKEEFPDNESSSFTQHRWGE